MRLSGVPEEGGELAQGSLGVVIEDLERILHAIPAKLPLQRAEDPRFLSGGEPVRVGDDHRLVGRVDRQSGVVRAGHGRGRGGG